jgi:hypothetical protein
MADAELIDTRWSPARQGRWCSVRSSPCKVGYCRARRRSAAMTFDLILIIAGLIVGSWLIGKSIYLIVG